VRTRARKQDGHSFIVIAASPTCRLPTRRRLTPRPAARPGRSEPQMQSRGVNTRGSGGGGHLRAGARAQIDRASSAGSSGSRVHPMIQICLYLLLPVRPGTARHVRRAALIIRMSHTHRNWESPKLTRPDRIWSRLRCPFRSFASLPVPDCNVRCF
jgi:hypothetical protein